MDWLMSKCNIQDQENIDMKEQLRGEIRKEINKLEMTCIDMASLLRGLGILVRGGSNPMSHDVSDAFMRSTYNAFSLNTVQDLYSISLINLGL